MPRGIFQKSSSNPLKLCKLILNPYGCMLFDPAGDVKQCCGNAAFFFTSERD
jgi:hypothetical protein